MTEWQDGLLIALRDYLVTRSYDAVKVIAYEDDTDSDGFCETCYYEYAVVVIAYLDSKGKRQSYTYRGGFSELINSL